MKISKLILTGMVLILAGCTAEEPSLEVNKTMQINAGLEDVWAHAGDFCAIGTWHPAVVECAITEEDGSTFRILTLGDGAQLKEKQGGDQAMEGMYSEDGSTFRVLTSDDSAQPEEKLGGDQARGYVYSIVEGPLPVKNYNAAFMAEGDADSATITWIARFRADGASDDEATEVITGIFDAGLASIRDNFEQESPPVESP